MTRQERKDFMIGITMCAVFVIVAVYLYTLPVDAANSSNMGSYGGDKVVDEYFIEETAETPKNPFFDANSAMPCVDREGFMEWYETYEQTASEEVEVSEREESSSEVPVNETRCEVSEEETETVQETVPHTAKVFSINGETLNPELQAMLFDALDRHGVGYWFEIGLCQMYQESRGNIYAENPNGKDKGILQYRLQFWDWNRGDIFSAQAQFELYAEQMAARLNAGLSVDECISRHNTSDYSTAVNWEYVAQVKQWLSKIREVN